MCSCCGSELLTVAFGMGGQVDEDAAARQVTPPLQRLVPDLCHSACNNWHLRRGSACTRGFRLGDAAQSWSKDAAAVSHCECSHQPKLVGSCSEAGVRVV